MAQDLGVCIVGCGMIARFHIKALTEIPGTRVTALVDTVPGAPQTLAEETKVSATCHGDLNDALKKKDVDIVIISTPSGAHMDSAVAAASAGKHVVVEKPLEITPDRCDRIIDTCDKNDVKLCTIFPSRFGDANATLKAAVEDGRFGRLTL